MLWTSESYIFEERQMKYEIKKDLITVYSLDEFSAPQIFNCGQIFRYEIIDNLAIVCANNKLALLVSGKTFIKIYCQDEKFFENYFDLTTNYEAIKNAFMKDNLLKPCCEFGYGIRILKQDLLEMIISFIVSANNNIKRIKKSLNLMSKKFGKKQEVPPKLEKVLKESNFDLLKSDIIFSENNKLYFYTFPSLENLKSASVVDFVECGLGYRAGQLMNTINKLQLKDLKNFNNLSREEKLKFLTSLSGVGNKVANCIMLFGANDMSAFPVDTWINKVYNDIYKTNTKNRLEIQKILTNKYEKLSGYAQQYFFYYYRENFNKK